MREVWLLSPSRPFSDIEAVLNYHFSGRSVDTFSDNQNDRGRISVDYPFAVALGGNISSQQERRLCKRKTYCWLHRMIAVDTGLSHSMVSRGIFWHTLLKRVRTT